MLQYLVILGALVSLATIISYCRDTLRGETKPNRVSWLLWSIAPLIGTAAALSSGVSWAALPIFMSGFGPLLVFICSFVNQKAYWKLEALDYACGALSLLALILWAITRDPLVALILAIASDALAAVPTIIKSFKNPETESIAPFAGGVFSASMGFFAVKAWTFMEFGFPLYLVLINLLLITAISQKFLRRL